MSVSFVMLRRPDWGGLGLSLSMAQQDCLRAVSSGLSGAAEMNACRTLGLDMLKGTVGALDAGLAYKSRRGV